MARLLMTAFGSLLIGVATWCIVGFLAVQVTGSGHDGGGAMSGFFFIGGVGGLVGATAGAILIWRLLADPARIGSVGGVLGGLLVFLAIGINYAIQPTHVERSNFPANHRGEFQLEASFPTERFAAIGKKETVTFQLRSGDGTLEAPWQRMTARQEGDRTIVPGGLKVKEVRTWILGIMQGDKQLDATDVGQEGFNAILEKSTEWSAWKPTDSGLQIRWRFAVLPR